MDRRLWWAAGLLVIALFATGALGQLVPAGARGTAAAVGLGAVGVLLLVMAPARPRATEAPRALSPGPAAPRADQRVEAD